MKSSTTLTPSESEMLQSYINQLDELAAQEPSIDDLDAWEAWNKKGSDLNEKYRDIVTKSLQVSLDKVGENLGLRYVSDVLKSFLQSDNENDLDTVKTQLYTLSKYGLMNDKTARVLLNREPEQRELDGQLSLVWAVNQAPQNRAQVPVYMALSYEGTNMVTNKKLTSKDDAILTAISNLIHVQQQNGIAPPYDFTAAQIWREMKGITDNRKSPSEKQKEEICNSIDKMRFTRLYMDISKEIEANYVTIDNERVKDGVADENYITAAKRRVKTVKGKEIDVYRFYSTPFIYEYNIAKGHIVLVNYDLLDTSDTIKDTDNVIEFRNYLLREIALMYKGDRDSNKILYETLYKSTGIASPRERKNRGKYTNENSYKTDVRNEAKKDREKVTAILQSWKNKKWIRDFTPVKRGRAYTGIEIELNPNNYDKPQIEKTQTKK